MNASILTTSIVLLAALVYRDVVVARVTSTQAPNSTNILNTTGQGIITTSQPLANNSTTDLPRVNTTIFDEAYPNATESTKANQGTDSSQALPGNSSTLENATDNGVEERGKEEWDHEHPGVELIVLNWKDVEYPFIVTLVLIFAGLSKLVFHFSHFLSSKVPESCVLIVLGVISGLILYYTGVTKDVKLYEPNLFFMYLLPPIILEAAYSLYDRTFAENIGGVILFAVLGTVLNCFLIGLSMYGLYMVGAMEDVHTSFVQMLLFAALIVAVDPVAVLAVFQEVGVNNMLYFLVFGESLLNDGVTVVLYDVMQIFITMPEITVGQIFLGIAKFFVVVIFGVLIGVVCGMMSSFITKFTNSVKVVEPLIVFGFAYMSYVLSDMFEFSGIISIITCGIVQAHYTFHNVTKKSRLAIKFLSKVMANASEIIVFLDLGIVTINLDYDWKTGFSLWALLFCIVYRFIVTYSLSACLNKFSAGRVRKIRLDEMFMISYGGLRGAVCFSLVALIDESHVPMKNLFVTTTLFIIFFTVFVQGGTIKWLVKKLRVKLAEGDPEMNLNRELASHVFDYILAGVEQIVGYTTGDHHIKKKLDKLDDKLIKPKLLKHATRTELSDISRCYEKVVMKEHYKNLHCSGAKLPKVDSDMLHKLEHVLNPNRQSDDDFSSSGTGTCDSYQSLVSRFEKQLAEDNLAYGDDVHKFFKYTLENVKDKILSTDAHVHDEHERERVNKGRTINEEGVETETGTIVFTL
ncbi:Na(+)/H(+) exchanger protein 7-like isoform X2 [Ruditapes philippinarum]|uniref:Na(+)/H(+) exchanger protein 7-like isoform X2 n=1 Tax=Ruditapes philippinarum TaxID=129788 RepID=UPI00295C08F7|nr:Na(+)/H(+) exchanger protein 7-like isoform X2 [Ruditapes philippinarum]